MPALGLSDGHLRDAMAEIARHLLALGARLYGGDLRQHGFSELLFELVSRHRRDSAENDYHADVMNFWHGRFISYSRPLALSRRWTTSKVVPNLSACSSTARGYRWMNG